MYGLKEKKAFSSSLHKQDITANVVTLSWIQKMFTSQKCPRCLKKFSLQTHLQSFRDLLQRLVVRDIMGEFFQVFPVGLLQLLVRGLDALESLLEVIVGLVADLFDTLLKDTQVFLEGTL